jgi:hypothetical protein
MTIEALWETFPVKTRLLYGVAEFAVSMMHSAIMKANIYTISLIKGVKSWHVL